MLNKKLSFKLINYPESMTYNEAVVKLRRTEHDIRRINETRPREVNLKTINTEIGIPPRTENADEQQEQ